MRRLRALKLTDKQRELLKRPLGELLRGSPDQTLPRLASMVAKENPPLVVAVGDAVSRTMLSAGIRVDIMVIDHREQRKVAGDFSPKRKTIHASNEAGTIEPAAVHAISDAVKLGNAVVAIDGEEDLLTLPALLSAPVGAFIVYGQPNEGIVIVRVDEKKKAEIHGIVESMSVV